ncbi:hypothetical protein [uncultured Acinetobacter sp.]|mgnify:FL=1|uniref:hypothetical protein n=1 Tax=uncultured Acinetobacter sp. TaxID=165433 RepID=UPI002604D68A|nr:hypothetical protein [uncultured Acinetobacter sp.]
MSKIDDLKHKAHELADGLKLKAKEALVKGEQLADDLKHKAQDAKLKAEHKLHDVKHDKNTSQKDDEKSQR